MVRRQRNERRCVKVRGTGDAAACMRIHQVQVRARSLRERSAVCGNLNVVVRWR
jgi:hypothetical protein